MMAVVSHLQRGTFSNGNMIERHDGPTGINWTYTFDAENRLTQVSDGTTTTTYRYDASGGRVSRTVTVDDIPTATLYVGSIEIELVDSVEEQRTLYYGAGGAFRVIGGEEAGLYFRHTDHLGSTSLISDFEGTAVPNSSVIYAPFGEIRQGAQSGLTDFGYTGQRLDGSTGGPLCRQAGRGARAFQPTGTG